MTGLVSDPNGNLYGTAPGGKKSGSGVIYELIKPAQGQTAWTDKVLYTFPTCGAPKDCSRGSQPQALILDPAGNIYGVAHQGGSVNAGTVFKLAPPISGKTAWTFSLLYTFKGGLDGRYPVGRLTIDVNGNLYGVTQQGGQSGSGCFSNGCGTAYVLTPPQAGKKSWTKSVIYSFSISSTSVGPSGGMIFDSLGNLYGTIYDSNSIGGGQVYQLTPPTAGQTTWTETILWQFSGSFAGCGPDGAGVNGGLIFDSAGNLYGTTYYGGGVYFQGGECGGSGTVFQLEPPSGDQFGWTEVVLNVFDGFVATDGAAPNGDLVLDPSSNLYGTTIGGGTAACQGGTVFKITPGQIGGSGSFNSLYSFAGCSSGRGPDGGQPLAGVVLDSLGNIYGTNSFGGLSANGTVFELAP
jgi:uncharacterized repeat protein (TIGR03803 family)